MTQVVQGEQVDEDPPILKVLLVTQGVQELLVKISPAEQEVQNPVVASQMPQFPVQLVQAVALLPSVAWNSKAGQLSQVALLMYLPA